MSLELLIQRMFATTPHVIGERWARHSYRSFVAQRIPTIFTQPTSLIRIADASIPIHDSGALGTCIQAGSILGLCHIFCFAREDWYTLCMKQPTIVWESRVLNSGCMKLLSVSPRRENSKCHQVPIFPDQNKGPTHQVPIFPDQNESPWSNPGFQDLS